ncbi:MAG: hypothetical protein PHU29_08975 [Sulfuricurvum sp.]|uniref:hypothetical protein n=1 Tax=Sulfuricurvum sp. TaxID=2025608 RepID=UPI00261CACCE|nr:hypothetical protein [Sulfuricurvum sp.]MDD2950906.1 hypothetical protein [Sulfuricurvum sp.]MDD5119376.1 hypothetical protein [Sulfuricurvum sp.]
MNGREVSYNFAKWIAIFGLSPLLYVFFGTITFAFLVNIINRLIIADIDAFLNTHQILFMAAALIGYLIFLYLIIRREKRKNIQSIDQPNNKFLLGVFLIYIGHLGLLSFYALVIYGILKGPGSSSGIFSIPMILWMLIFYTIGFNIVANQRFSEMLKRKNEKESST